MISPNKPNSRAFQPGNTNQTNHWVALEGRTGMKETCYFESRHILGRMGGNLKPLSLFSSHNSGKEGAAAESPWARH